jgi:hypothetical protein
MSLGSNSAVGRRFQVFEINDLEMVDQTFSSSNPLITWLQQMDGLRAVL